MRNPRKCRQMLCSRLPKLRPQLAKARLHTLTDETFTNSVLSSDTWQYNGFSRYELGRKPGARFIKYLMTISRLSYDNAKVTIDLRRTSN